LRASDTERDTVQAFYSAGMSTPKVATRSNTALTPCREASGTRMTGH